MPTTKCACPRCHLPVLTTKELPAQVKCPQCGAEFTATTNGAPRAAADRPSRSTVPVAAGVAAPPPSRSSVNLRPQAPSTSPADRRPAAPTSSFLPAVLILSGVGALLVVAVIVAVIILAGGKQAPVADNSGEKDKDSSRWSAPREDHRLAPMERPNARGEAVPKPGPLALESPAGSVKWAALSLNDQAGFAKPVYSEAYKHQLNVNRAIDRGVAYVKASLAGQVTDTYRARPGAAALAGLTLLSCGVPADDAAVVQAVQRVRAQAPSSPSTYDMALMILFLDRLGEARDKDLIQTLALELIASQGVLGGWNYNCHLLKPEKQKELLELLTAKTPSQPAPEGKPASSARTSPKTNPRRNTRTPTALPADLKTLPVFQYEPGQPLEFRTHGHEDNSLTQFAVLALWAAQKHGVPAERSLALAEARFRASQNPDGSWGYTWINGPNNGRVDSMTCAGLLGLAVGRGISKVKNARPPAAIETGDPVIEKALRFLGKRVGQPAVRMSAGRTPERSSGATGGVVGASTWGDYYYLWSLERVAVVYDLQTIGGHDWYLWGSKILVANQGDDGSWAEAFPGLIDTCFALLFLKRVNVVQDLTTALQVVGQPKDPYVVGTVPESDDERAKRLSGETGDKLASFSSEKIAPTSQPGKIK
jgi:hypothetical protein